MDAGHRLLIYGATGAVGRRLAEIAASHEMTVVLAGRRRAELESLAAPLGAEVRVAPLDRVGSVFEGVSVVASCVGPYTHFGMPVLMGAISAGAHYLDLTGEPRYVATLLDRHDRRARRAGVTIVPSAGLGLCSGLAARSAVAALGGPVTDITVGYLPWGMRPSRGTIQSTIEIVAGGAPVIDKGMRRFVIPGGIHRTPLGLGARFPLTDPLTMSTLWPHASIDSFLLTAAAPALACVLAGVGLAGRSTRAMRGVRALERRIGGPARPGGKFGIAVAASDGNTSATARVDVDDTYELTSQAAFEVARRLCDGFGAPGVRMSAAVVSEPADVAARLGVRLRRLEGGATGPRN
jgi:Saccharopine dehydrogenase NADP binding domain